MSNYQIPQTPLLQDITQNPPNWRIINITFELAEMGPKRAEHAPRKKRQDLRIRKPPPTKTGPRTETQLEQKVECRCSLFGPGLGVHILTTRSDKEKHEDWIRQKQTRALVRKERLQRAIRDGVLPDQPAYDSDDERFLRQQENITDIGRRRASNMSV